MIQVVDTNKIENLNDEVSEEPLDYSLAKCDSEDEDDNEGNDDENTDLLINSPLDTLYKSVKQNHQVMNKQMIKIEQDETVSQASQNNNVKNMNLHHQPELQFTLEDSDLVDKLHDTLSSATMNLVRQELIQGVVDMVMGEISHEELLSILKRGRSRQNLLHTTIMSSLPFYTDLSTK